MNSATCQYLSIEEQLIITSSMQEIDNKQNLENQGTGVGLSAENTLVFPVIEERLVIENKTVEAGKVVISKKVLQEESTVTGVATSEEVIVERKEINRYVDSAPAPVRQEGDVTIISVVKEVLIIEKRLMLVEELHVSKVRKQGVVEHTDTVRREEVTVSRMVPDRDPINSENHNQ